MNFNSYFNYVYLIKKRAISMTHFFFSLLITVKMTIFVAW